MILPLPLLLLLPMPLPLPLPPEEPRRSRWPVAVARCCLGAID